MRKLPTDSRLGAALRTHRKSRGFTQGALAAAAGLAEKTLRQLEHGRGNLDSWHATLERLGLELAGRNLPPGEALGRRLAALRRRRRLGQRELADLVGVSQPTVVALERQGRGRLDTLERVLETLGAGAYLAPCGQARAFFTHAGNASVSHEWETPAELLQVLHSVFGRFDLDPCAPRRTRTRVRARRHLTAADDGLAAPWGGVVFVNPPYGRELARWVAKCRREVELGHAKTVVALVPARPDTAYWHEHIAGRATVYFLRGRLRFGDGSNGAPFPSALAVWGADTPQLAALDAALAGAWRAG